MPHLQTFARLHVAGSNEVSSLRELDASIRGEAGAPARDWSLDAANRDSHIVLAMECQATVGAIQIIHSVGDAVATLVWLGVAHSARGRGIGQLLVESAIEYARSAGAAVLRLGSMAVSAPALSLLTASGFVERTYDTTHVVFEKSLWDERSVRQTRASAPCFYASDRKRGSPAAVLMVAMGTIDSRFIMTPQVERVIATEVDQQSSSSGDILQGMAAAVARRSFKVAIHGAFLPVALPGGAIDDGTILTSTKLPTAQELIGLLSRRQIPLLRARFDRLHMNGTESAWLVVLCFNGLLFQVFDPRRPDQHDQAVTLSEMREALADHCSTCVVVARD